MGSRAWRVEVKEKLLNVIPFRRATTAWRGKRLRSSTIGAAGKAEEAKDVIIRGVRRGTYTKPEQLQEDVKIFTGAQQEEAEGIRDGILDFIPPIAEAQRRIRELQEVANELMRSDKVHVRSEGIAMSRELTQARNALWEALNSTTLTLHEKKLAHSKIA